MIQKLRACDDCETGHCEYVRSLVVLAPLDGASRSAAARGACASWRIVRVVTGKLIEHPYLRYQQGAGVGSLLGNRLSAEWIAVMRKDRSSGLKA